MIIIHFQHITNRIIFTRLGNKYDFNVINSKNKMVYPIIKYKNNKDDLTRSIQQYRML